MQKRAPECMLGGPFCAVIKFFVLSYLANRFWVSTITTLTLLFESTA